MTTLFQFDFDNSGFQCLCWIHEDALAHWLYKVDDVLLGCFQNRVISLNEGVAWLLCSPDLTPHDYFLWRYLQKLTEITN